MKSITRAYIALGSNLNDPVKQIQLALKALNQISNTQLIQTSSLYRNPPLGTIEQPDFINAVAALDTQLNPQELLAALQAIEIAQGRKRTGQWGEPRTLDLDLLLYGDECLNTTQLTVPHPGLTTRNFVLYPLIEIAPDLRLPTGADLKTLQTACSARGLTKLI